MRKNAMTDASDAQWAAAVARERVVRFLAAHLVRLIEALAVPRPHGKRCSSAEALPRRSVAVYRLAAKIY
jgi:hypothetical protein